MTRDPLDHLLDSSRPLAATAVVPELHTMLAEARTEARAEARPAPKARRAAVIGGVLALLLVGGAGVATASSDWLWGAGLENPDRSYTYTSPTWGQCEIRYSRLDTHNPLIQAEVDRIIDDWFATTDVEAAAAPYVAGYLAELESDPAADAVSDPREPDLNAWQAHDNALAQALYEELARNGIDSDRGDLAGAESHSQVHCDDEDWGGE